MPPSRDTLLKRFLLSFNFHSQLYQALFVRSHFLFCEASDYKVGKCR